ncbi:hypothetical protein [Candidatus Pelagibacter sp.]|uniref:hypothetical protein n=1 Tax=Candidatus Pelagibacter sp. TaxID=2024849 RepID=UPI003D143355
MTNIYKVKVDVVEKSTSTREEIIKAESADEAQQKVINYCNEQLVDNDNLKQIVEVKVSNAKDAVTEVKNKDLPNDRAGNPVSYT